VDAVVDGTVSCSGDRVRITAQLIHAPTDRHLWAGSYERELHDILLLQHEVALAIATEVEIHLSPVGKERLSSPLAPKPEALEAYRRGRYFWSRRSEEALNRAIEYFNRAIQEDPGYAPAYAGLSDSYTALALNSMRSPLETFPKAKAAALAALKMDDQLADAHFSLAAVLMFYEWDWLRAELGFKRSIELNPGYTHARTWYALELAALGRQVEALAECERVLRIDPLSRHIMLSFATVLYLARDYDRAIAMCERILEMDPPGFYQAHWVLGAAYERKRMCEQAIRSFEMATAISNRNPHMLAGLGHALAKSGQTRDACKLIDELNERATHSYVAPLNMAMVYAGLGQKVEALEWLERAYEKRSVWMIFLNADPIFDDLRPEPGFQVLVRRMGFLP
jgi:tetratricopeptide (TPR) repeat protein